MKIKIIKNKEVMKRTIVVIDAETDRILSASAEKMGLSRSAYIRMLIRQSAAGR